jgi:hypothetical protein
MRLGTIQAIAWLGVLLLVTVLLVGGSGEDANAAVKAGDGVATVAQPAAILTRADLENTSNPYRNEYQEWDYWLVDHQVQESEATGNCGGTDGETSIVGYIDDDGWLRPCLEVERAVEENAKNGTGRDYLRTLKEEKRVYAEGIMEPAVAQARLQAIREVKASYFPEIPEFLGTNPPRRTMLLSSDRIVTIGLPGSGSLIDPYQLDPNAPPQEALPFYLWDSAGNQLGETSHSWHELLGAPMEEVYRIAREAGCDTKFASATPMGYIGYNDAETGKLKVLFDYDGTRMDPPDLSLHRRDEHNYMFISADSLSAFYMAQHQSTEK